MISYSQMVFSRILTTMERLSPQDSYKYHDMYDTIDMMAWSIKSSS